MVQRVANWVAGVVLGLSVLAWAGSYLGVTACPALGKGVLILDSGALHYGETDKSVPPPRPIKVLWVLPFWIPIVLSLVTLWGMWRFGIEERRRAMEGHCVSCGYDLTGIDGVCPECGRSA